jgi:SAM-dependent methyltransferase
MDTPERETISCPVCRSAESSVLFSVTDSVIERPEERWNIVRCPRCTLVYINPRPALENWLEYYRQPTSYYKSSPDDVSACINRLKKFKPGRLLDIGCGQGGFLNEARALKWDVQGIDVSDTIPNPHNLPIKYGDFNTMELPQNHYDLVTFWGVTEYIREPAGFFKKLAGIVKDNGAAMFVMSNFNSIQRSYMRVHNFPRQQQVWTFPALRYVCAEAGLEITSRDYSNDVRGGRCTELVTFLYKHIARGLSWDRILMEHARPDKKNLTMLAVKTLDRLITLPLSAAASLFGYNGVMNITLKRKKLE